MLRSTDRSHRDRIVEALQPRGIQAGVHYPFPIHRLAAYRDVIRPTVSLDNAERWADECFSLPLYPELTELQREHVTSALGEVSDTSQQRNAAAKRR